MKQISITIVISIAAIAIATLALLVYAIWFTNGKCEQSQVKAFPVLPSEVKLNIQSDSVLVIDSVSVDELKKFNKNIQLLRKEVAQFDSIQKLNVMLQDDIRQETNNIIDKFNAWTGFWLAIFALLLGVVPLIITLRQQNAEKEYRKLLEEKFNHLVSETKTQISALSTTKTNLETAKTKLEKEWEAKKNEFALLNSSSSIATVTQVSTFQQLQDRNEIADELLKRLLTATVIYLDNESEEKDLNMCLISLREGLSLLSKFQSDRHQERRIEELREEVNKVFEDVFKREKKLEEIKDEIKSLSEKIKSFKTYRWH